MAMPKVDQGLELPKTLYLETTNRCNLKCKGCIIYHGKREVDRDVSLQEVIEITDQLPRLEQVILHGIGEPLLNKALPEIITHLKRRAVYVLFNSMASFSGAGNGTTLSTPAWMNCASRWTLLRRRVIKKSGAAITSLG